MPRALGQPVAGAIGASAWVGGPAAGQQHGLGPVFSPRRRYPYRAALFHQHPGHSLPAHLGFPGPAGQGLRNISGLVRLGKHPASPLGFQRDTQALKKGHNLFRREGVQGCVQELSSPRRSHRLLGRTVVGHIAAALASDAHLAPQLPVFLEKDHWHALGGQGSGS